MKLIEAKYDEYSGISQAIVEHKGRLYIGLAQCHPEEEFPSKFAGCRYAEARAKLKALKAERREKIKLCDECRNLIKACSQCKNFDKESPTAKVLYRQLNCRIKEINNLTDKINELMHNLNIAIKQREVVNNAIKNKKSKEDN